ncbi:hypothetical protein AFLA_012500 [Aspergillus flavus NRRL3357]|nr:hypothetical protein AFLA_012500 [Aspergillus flavus NRRL3357]
MRTIRPDTELKVAYLFIYPITTSTSLAPPPTGSISYHIYCKAFRSCIIPTKTIVRPQSCIAFLPSAAR